MVSAVYRSHSDLLVGHGILVTGLLVGHGILVTGLLVGHGILVTSRMVRTVYGRYSSFGN